MPLKLVAYSYCNITWKLKLNILLLFTVPGDGGSRIDAKLDKPEVVHYFCDKKTDKYDNIWLNLELLVPLVIDCLVSNKYCYIIIWALSCIKFLLYRFINILLLITDW